jgi:hypothetical protein
MRQSGRIGRKGTNQTKVLMLAVPDHARATGVIGCVIMGSPWRSASCSAKSSYTQSAVKDGLVGLGFTDVSDRKDRGYFDSVYVRTPAGAMFEATVSKATGFVIDEPFEELGKNFQVPPVFADRREFLLSSLEPLHFS